MGFFNKNGPDLKAEACACVTEGKVSESNIFRTRKEEEENTELHILPVASLSSTTTSERTRKERKNRMRDRSTVDRSKQNKLVLLFFVIDERTGEKNWRHRRCVSVFYASRKEQKEMKSTFIYLECMYAIKKLDRAPACARRMWSICPWNAHVEKSTWNRQFTAGSASEHA